MISKKDKGARKAGLQEEEEKRNRKEVEKR